MAEIQFSEIAWEDYLYWQKQDKKTLKRINDLLKEISRTGKPQKGKPELLKGDFSGSASVRIDGQNRLVYSLDNGIIKVEQCRNHYSDK